MLLPKAISRCISRFSESADATTFGHFRLLRDCMKATQQFGICSNRKHRVAILEWPITRDLILGNPKVHNGKNFFCKKFANLLLILKKSKKNFSCLLRNSFDAKTRFLTVFRLLRKIAEVRGANFFFKLKNTLLSTLLYRRCARLCSKTVAYSFVVKHRTFTLHLGMRREYEKNAKTTQKIVG